MCCSNPKLLPETAVQIQPSMRGHYQKEVNCKLQDKLDRQQHLTVCLPAVCLARSAASCGTWSAAGTAPAASSTRMPS
jgi:hypothetical protein